MRMSFLDKRQTYVDFAPEFLASLEITRCEHVVEL